MKQFKKLLALLLVLCVAGLPVFALATDETGDGQSTEAVSDPPQDPAPEPPKEQPKEPEPEKQPDPEPVVPPTTNENPDPPETNPENPPTTETTTETTTDAPVTETTEVPTTDAPTTDAPTTDAPTTSAPTTEEVNPTESASTDETVEPTETPMVMLMAQDEPLLISTPIDGIEISEDGLTLTVKKPNNSTSVQVSSILLKLEEEPNVQKIVVENEGVITGTGNITVEVENGGRIQGGNYTQKVTNGGTIQGTASFEGTVINNKNINDGTFEKESTVENNGSITKGTFKGAVTNEGEISDANDKTKFEGIVTNSGTISGGTFNDQVTNTKEITGGTFNDVVSNAAGATLSGEETKFNGTVNNEGKITGGTFSGEMLYNTGTIEDGKFTRSVNNYGTIEDGTFTDGSVVTNGDEQKPAPIMPPAGQATPEPTATPLPGTIKGGTFEKGSKLHNCWSVEDAKIDGTIYTYLNSSAENCTFSATSEAVNQTGGEIDVTYYVDGRSKTDAHFYDYAKDKLDPAEDGNVWYYYLRGVGESVSVKRTLEPNATIGVRGPDYLQSASPSPAPTQNPATKPTTSTKPSGNGNGSGNSGISPWGDPAVSDWSDPEGEEEIVLGPEQSLADDFLKDGDSVKLDIMHNGSGAGTDYELIPIPATTPEPTATDGTAAVDDSSELDLGALDAATDAAAEPEATEEPEDTDSDGIPDEEDEDIDGDGILNEEDEDADGNGVPDAEEAEEEIARIPGEADEEGNVPGMLYVRAKGLGTEERKLTLTFSQLERMHREQSVDVLLFRNGSATVSMNVSPLFEGNIAKLMELMHAWEYNGANFDDYDLSIIDFDAIQIAPVFTDEELREFKLEMSIAPAVPVGYTVQVKLCLGENSKEISLLLEEMGVTMHAQTVTDNVAVYYMNAEQERFLLETHEGVVPGVDTEIEGYEVLFDNGTATVLDLNRSVTDTEFAGLCASTGDTGTYYIGVLPSAQASAGPTDEEAEAEETPEPTEEPTPEPTATEEPEDLSMELVVDVPR